MRKQIVVAGWSQNCLLLLFQFPISVHRLLVYRHLSERIGITGFLEYWTKTVHRRAIYSPGLLRSEMPFLLHILVSVLSGLLLFDYYFLRIPAWDAEVDFRALLAAILVDVARCSENEWPYYVMPISVLFNLCDVYSVTFC